MPTGNPFTSASAAQTLQATPYSTEQQSILRQQQLADLLRKQSLDPMGDTQMVGGWAVKRSPMEGAAKLAQALGANFAQQGAENRSKELSNRQTEDFKTTAERYAEALRGAPGIQGQDIYTDDYTAVPKSDQEGYGAQAAIPGSQKNALAIALQSQHPMWQQFAMQQIMKEGAGNADKFGKVNPHDYTPESVRTFSQTGDFSALVPVRKKEFVNGQAVDAFGVAPGTVIPKQANPYSDLVVPGADGRIVPNAPLIGAKQSIAKAGASNVNVSTKQETEEAKTVGKGFGEQYVDLQKADQAASGKIARMDRLSSLLDGVNTGKLTPAGTEISALAKSMGFNIDDKLGNKQAADALSNEIALQMRNPSGGAGMPGALSDKDREFLVAMTPGIGKDQSSNKLMIETVKKLAQREKDVARLARDYRQKNGQLNEGFYNELSKFSDANPLFPSSSSKPSGGGKNIDALLKKYGG